MTALYSLESVRKTHGPAFSLEIASLEVREGGIHALSGPNGSGKSTLLSILAFLDRPTCGRIRFDGETVAWNARSLAALRRQVTLLHQNPWLFGGTVFENVAWGLQVRGIPGENRRARVGEALEAVGLAGFAERDAKSLSGGEAQRAAMARAIALKPRVLLLDEPFSGVDRAAADATEALLASLPARGTTVLLTTHDPARFARLGGTVIGLSEGKIIDAHPLREADCAESSKGMHPLAVV